MGFNISFNINSNTQDVMKTSEMKIALCGPSGSGKSTLARRLSEEFGIPYTENSAGLLLPKEDQDFLVDTFGWEKKGHQSVIQLSNIKPPFGWEFQKRLMEARAAFIRDNDNFVIDRSPVDNVSYYLLQNSHLQPDNMTTWFINQAISAMEPITHLIFIPTMISEEIENNGSRITSIHYQQMVTQVFAHVIRTYFPFVKTLELNTSIRDVRWRMTTRFLFTQ